MPDKKKLQCNKNTLQCNKQTLQCNLLVEMYSVKYTYLQNQHLEWQPHHPFRQLCPEILDPHVLDPMCTDLKPYGPREPRDLDLPPDTLIRQYQCTMKV